MTMKMTKCDEFELAEMLFEPEKAGAAVKAHVAGCAACTEQLAELKATMGLLDEWKVTEPSPYFMTRMGARLNEEREHEPASLLVRVWNRVWLPLAFGPQRSVRPLAAMAMTLMLLVGGGAYVGLSHDWEPQPQPGQAAVVHDLQNLDSNAQLLDQLESMSNTQDTNE
jgi:anti-sigma factor RsiW